MQSSNDYVRQWLDHKDEFLESLLDMEAPPDPRKCSICERDGIYRCSDCFGQPLFCTLCAREGHQRHPFHRIRQWTGSFFEESSLNLVRALLVQMMIEFYKSIDRLGLSCILVILGFHAQ